MSTKGTFSLLVLDGTRWHNDLSIIVLSFLRALVYLVYQCAPVIHMGCKLQIRNCRFTPGMHLYGAQPCQNDLTFRSCRNTNSNTIAKPPQSMGVHIEFSKVCSRHPIRGLQLVLLGPEYPPFNVMLMINASCTCKALFTISNLKTLSLQGCSLMLPCEVWWICSKFSQDSFNKLYGQFKTAREIHRHVNSQC